MNADRLQEPSKVTRLVARTMASGPAAAVSTVAQARNPAVYKHTKRIDGSTRVSSD
jgi:hypothetical protein